MNDKIEKKLKQEIEAAVPDVFDKILEASQNEDNVTIVTFPSVKKKRKTVYRTVVSIAAVLAVVLLSGYAWMFANPKTENCRIEFNVNPCVILEIDKNERVADVRAENDDAKIVLEDMDLMNTDIDVAINALMFSMIKHGYIDEMTNSVLVSVSENGNVDYSDISQHIAQKMNEVFSKSSIEGSVMIQSFHEDGEIIEIADKYGISEGKAALIKSLVDQKLTVFSYDALSKLSINEINILMNESNAQSDVTVLGVASRKAYIGEDTAKSIAYEDAKVDGNDVKHSEFSLSLDDGALVYEFEFIVAGAVYEYEINALTGKILSRESEPVKTDTAETTSSAQTEPESTPSYKTKEEIKEKVLEINNLTSSDYKTFEIEMDIEDGKAVYEVEFFAKGTKYEYEIDALTGTILSSSFEDITTKAPTASSETSNPKNNNTDESGLLYIGIEKAKQIAFEHAQVENSEQIRAEIEFGYNSGVVYCVEFDYHGMEYEYEINARTGEIVDFEKSLDD